MTEKFISTDISTFACPLCGKVGCTKKVCHDITNMYGYFDFKDKKQVFLVTAKGMEIYKKLST